MCLYIADQNLALIWQNLCGEMRVYLHSKCMVEFAFLSTHLRSSTYIVMGLLAVAGHPIVYAKRVWTIFNLYSDRSYATVQAHARADVMYAYVRLRDSEIWLHTPFSILHSIYPNSS